MGNIAWFWYDFKGLVAIHKGDHTSFFIWWHMHAPGADKVTTLSNDTFLWLPQTQSASLRRNGADWFLRGIVEMGREEDCHHRSPWWMKNPYTQHYTSTVCIKSLPHPMVALLLFDASTASITEPNTEVGPTYLITVHMYLYVDHTYPYNDVVMSHTYCQCLLFFFIWRVFSTLNVAYTPQLASKYMRLYPYFH